MKVDLDFRELVYAAKFASMEAEMTVLSNVLHKLTLGVADCNIQDGLE